MDTPRYSFRTSEPTGEIRAEALLVPALGVRGTFYDAFAAWLAGRGLRVQVLEHAGSTSPAAMRAHRGDLLGWFDGARQAFDEVADSAEGTGVPAVWIGHSIGSVMLPFAAHERAAAALTLGSGSAWVGHFPPRLRTLGGPGLRFLLPVLVGVFGWFPGRRLRLLGDMPAGVARQWRRWCLDQRYVGVDMPDAAEAFARVRTPMRVVSFADDELVTPAAHADLHDRFVNAPQERIVLSPDEVGVDRIRHIAGFRPGNEATWAAMVGDWPQTVGA